MGGAITQVGLGGGRGWLAPPAAASIRRIDAQIGHYLQITEAGRTWLQQDEHWQTYLRNGWPIALSPNAPSIHQLGGAADSNEAQRIIAVMEDHGWRRTVYRNGKLVEPWHFEYFAHLDNHLNEGDDMPLDAEERNALFSVYNAVFKGGGDAGDQSLIARIVENQKNLRAIGPRVVNIDTQVTGADGFDSKVGPSVAGRLISTQIEVVALRAQVAALLEAVQGLSGGELDMERVEQAAREGAQEALAQLRLVADTAADRTQ